MNKNNKCKYSWQQTTDIEFFEDDEKGLLICLAKSDPSLDLNKYKKAAKKIASFFPKTSEVSLDNQISFFEFIETPDMAPYRSCMDSFVILVDGCPRYSKGELLSLQGRNRIVLDAPSGEVIVNYQEGGEHGSRSIWLFLLFIGCVVFFIWYKYNPKQVDEPVKPEVEQSIAVSSVSLSKSTLTLMIGSTDTLRTVVNPKDAMDNRVSWVSSNPSVAKVSNGTVHALGVGSATITAKAGGKEAKCTVVVNPILVSMLSLDRSEVSLEVGSSIRLKPSINPSNATNPQLIWSSSNSSVAKVEDGVITAVSSGKATVSAKVDSKTAECIINVTAPKKPTSSQEVEKTVTLSRRSATLTVGQSITLTASVTPSGSVVWYSTNSEILKVRDGVVTALKPGAASVFAKSGETYSQSCNFKVNEPAPTLEELFNEHKKRGRVLFDQYVDDDTQTKIKEQALKELESARNIKKDGEVISMIKWLKEH